MQPQLDVLCLCIHAGVRYSWLCTTLYLLCREAGPQGEYAPFFFRLVTFVCSYLPHSLLCLPHTLPGEWLNQCTPVYKPKKLACKHTHKHMYTTNTHTVLLTDLQTAALFRPKCAETCIYLHPRHVFDHKDPNIYRVLELLRHRIRFSQPVVFRLYNAAYFLRHSWLYVFGAVQ